MTYDLLVRECTCLFTLYMSIILGCTSSCKYFMLKVLFTTGLKLIQHFRSFLQQPDGLKMQS